MRPPGLLGGQLAITEMAAIQNQGAIRLAG
jgi:hypothetical protein